METKLQHCPVRGFVVALLLLISGCGGSPSDPPADTSVAGAVDKETKSTSIAPRSPTIAPPPAPSKIPPATVSAVAPTDHHLPASTSRSSNDRHPSRQESKRDAVEQEAWAQWYQAARDSPDVMVRLQALETWAQRPGDVLDPVTYGLVDQDETVRNRAQALYDQALAREATELAQSSQPGTRERAEEP